MPARWRERKRRQVQWKVRTPEEKQILEIASAESRRRKEEIGRLGEPPLNKTPHRVTLIIR